MIQVYRNYTLPLCNSKEYLENLIMKLLENMTNSHKLFFKSPPFFKSQKNPQILKKAPTVLMFALSLFCLTPFLICFVLIVLFSMMSVHCIFSYFCLLFFGFCLLNSILKRWNYMYFFIICLHFRPTRIVFNRHRPPFYEHNHCWI